LPVDVASLPPDYEIAPKRSVCLGSTTRPATQKRIQTLLERGLHKPGETFRSAAASGHARCLDADIQCAYCAVPLDRTRERARREPRGDRERFERHGLQRPCPGEVPDEQCVV